MSEPTRIRVSGAQPYDVVVGEGLLDELEPLLRGAQRVAVVHPAALRTTADAVRDDLAGSGFDASALEVPDGEQQKDLKVAAYCWDVLGQLGFTRTDAVVAVGGSWMVPRDRIRSGDFETVRRLTAEAVAMVRPDPGRAAGAR